jgi:hypothetical protein
MDRGGYLHAAKEEPSGASKLGLYRSYRGPIITYVEADFGGQHHATMHA